MNAHYAVQRFQKMKAATKTLSARVTQPTWSKSLPFTPIVQRTNEYYSQVVVDWGLGSLGFPKSETFDCHAPDFGHAQGRQFPRVGFKGSAPDGGLAVESQP